MSMFARSVAENSSKIYDQINHIIEIVSLGLKNVLLTQVLNYSFFFPHDYHFMKRVEKTEKMKSR